jgi:hypothetical protein
MKPIVWALLALVLLTGCMHQSQAMLELLNSPVYGPWLDYWQYRPLRVEHVEPDR